MNKSDYYKCGFRRLVCAVPQIKIADTAANFSAIAKVIEENQDADFIVFPELSISGYTCADLFQQSLLLDNVEVALAKLLELSDKVAYVVGAPLRFKNEVYNCAVFFDGYEILGVVPKIFLPNYAEYYEARWFASGSEVPDDARISINGRTYPFGTKLIFNVNGMKIGAEICEDLWVPEPPSGKLCLAGADVIVNLSASNETIGKHHYRTSLISQQSARCRCVYAYASAGAGESSTDLAFPGYAAIAEDGSILAQSPRFSEGEIMVKADVDLDKIHHDRLKANTFRAATGMVKDYHIINSMFSNAYTGNLYEDFCLNNPFFEDEEEIKTTEEKPLIGRAVDPHPFVPSDPQHRNENCTEIINIQCHGLRQRLSAINCRTLVIGVSGGLDSTLALLVACRTFDQMGIPRSGIQAITMPGLATTSRTRSNAWKLTELLGVTCIEIPIAKAVDVHFSDIGQDPEKHDAAYENSQARERTQILMDYANKCGGIVLGTGDLSELALGWCTYNGDHMSMYAVNSSVPKTLVKHLVEWFADREKNREIAEILIDIINTPISPELVPSDDDVDTIAQKTEDLVGPYELHDFFLYHTLRNGFSPRKIFLLARRAFGEKYSDAVLLKWERNFYRRFFSQQFKRSCMPDGPKVGSVCLSPRGDWRMPSDASSRNWLDEVDKLEKEFVG